MKTCTKCNKKRDLNNFNKNKWRKDGLDHYCKSCRSEANVNSSVKQKEHIKCRLEGCVEAHYAKNLCKFHYSRKWKSGHTRGYRSKYYRSKPANVKYKYGLDYELYLEMIDGGCLICESKDFLQVDHNHACCPNERSCGKCVRGVICARCNNLVSHYERGTLKNQVMLEAIAEYVKKGKKKVA